jgi:hypothetical protein
MGCTEDVGNHQPMSTYTIKSLRTLDGRVNIDLAGHTKLLWKPPIIGPWEKSSHGRLTRLTWNVSLDMGIMFAARLLFWCIIEEDISCVEVDDSIKVWPTRPTRAPV